MVAGEHIAEELRLGTEESITDQACAHLDLRDTRPAYRPLLFQGCDSVAECWLVRAKHIYDCAWSIVGVDALDDL